MIRERGVSKGRMGESLREVENKGALWGEVGGAGKTFARGDSSPSLSFPLWRAFLFPTSDQHFFTGDSDG